MRFFIGYLLSSLSVIVCLTAHAQNGVPAIQGVIYIENNVAADAASATLLKQADSSTVASMVTGKNGAFKFNVVEGGTYIMVIKRAGYQKYYSAPITAVKQTLNLPAIHLVATVVNLKEVTIIDKKSFIDVRRDKTVLNIEKGIAAGGSSILDVLATAPGIRVKSDDEILFKGGQKALVTINGKQTYLSAADMAAQLRNLQTGDVESVELIANPSAKYDATGGGGVVNIILKKGKNVGFNGNISSGAGYGNFYKYNLGGGFNYRTAKINLFGNLSYLEGKTDHGYSADRLLNQTTAINYQYYNTLVAKSPSYRFGADFTIDSAHTIGFLINGNHIHYFFDKNNRTDIFDNSIRDSNLVTTSGLARDVDNISYNINYNGSIGSKNQQLSADADYALFNRNTLENITSNFYNIGNPGKNSTQYFRSIVPTKITIASARVDYINNLSSKTKLEAGLKQSYAKSDNNQFFGDLVGSNYITDPYFSSYFNLKEYITYGYVNFTKKGKLFDYNAGLRVEQTNSKANSTTAEADIIDRAYTDFFPQAQITYKYNNNNRLSFNYSRRIDRPSYEDLNTIVAYQDRYNYRTGNAFLKPSYQDNIQLSHNYLGKYLTSLYFLRVDDFYNFNYFSQNDITKVYTTNKINLKHMYAYGLTFNAPVRITHWWNVNLDVDASYQRFMYYSGNLTMNTRDVIVKLNHDFDFGHSLTASIRTYYEAPTFYGITSLKAFYYTNAGISKKILKQAGTIALTMDDVFNTRRDRYTSNFINLNVIGYDKKETNIARFSFTYRFGKKTVKAARTHDGGNTAEKSRIGNTNN